MPMATVNSEVSIPSHKACLYEDNNNPNPTMVKRARRRVAARWPRMVGLSTLISVWKFPITP